MARTQHGKVLILAQIRSAAAAAARDAVEDAEAQALVLNERLRLLTEEREIHVLSLSLCKRAAAFFCV